MWNGLKWSLGLTPNFSGEGDVPVPVLIWTSAVWYIVLQFSGKATK